MTFTTLIASDGVVNRCWLPRLQQVVAVMRLTKLSFPIYLCLWASAGQAADAIALSAEQTALAGIETAPLAQQAKTRGTEFPARVTIPPHQITVVSAPLSARIESIEVKEDQSVTRGAALVRLHSPMLIRAQSEFLQSINQERFLRESLAREQSLSADRIVPLKQLQATKNEHAQATATVAERRQILRDYGMSDDAIETLLSTRAFDSRMGVAAPLDGVVLDIAITPGQRVEAQAPLLKVARLDPLWLELQVPARQAARFAPGIPVVVSNYDVSARVIAIGTIADRATQAVTIRAEVTNGSSGLKPGQFVEVLVDLARNGERAWQVRPEAVVRRGKEAYVFVKTADGFRAQGITVLEETQEAVVISGPFRGDESIAVRGLIALKGAWQGLGGSQ